MKKRTTEEQILDFLKQAEAGVPVKELCWRHGFSDASFYTWRAKFWHDRAGCQTAQGSRTGEQPAEKAAGRCRSTTSGSIACTGLPA